MGATCSTHRPTRQRWRREDAVGRTGDRVPGRLNCIRYLGHSIGYLDCSSPNPAALIIAIGVVLAGFGHLGGLSAQTPDVGAPPPATRFAAASNGPTVPLGRPSLRVPSSEEHPDLRLLVAQTAPTAMPNGKLRDDTVLVAFAASAPENSEEEVANEHGLELVDRTELPALGLRIARYRVRGDRPVAALIASLRTDRRVQQAQGNFEYRPVSQSPAAFAAAKPDNDPSVSARRRTDRTTAAVNKVAQKPGEQTNIGEVVSTGAAGKLHKGDRPLAAAGHTALRWPTADEPFVNVGVANR